MTAYLPTLLAESIVRGGQVRATIGAVKSLIRQFVILSPAPLRL